MSSDKRDNKKNRRSTNDAGENKTSESGELDCNKDQQAETRVKNANAAGIGAIAKNDESIPGTDPENPGTNEESKY